MKQNNSLKEIGQQLLAADSVLLFPHVNIDGDALGSCVALCAALRNAGKQAWILTEEEVGEYVGFLDNGYCTQDQEIIGTPDICMCVDCSETKRFPGREETFFKGKTTVCLDHHFTGEPFADYNYIDGALGDVRIWSTTRTAEEIRSTMYTELSGSETGLMSCWKLDEQNGVNFADCAETANHGTIDVAWLEDNQGLEFAGNQGVVAPLSKATGTVPQTVEAWVKIDTDTTAGRTAIIGAFTGPYTADAQKGDWALFTNASGSLWWYEKNANGQYSTAKGASLKTGTWTHVAITREEGLIKYYINGEEVSSVASDKIVSIKTPVR